MARLYLDEFHSADSMFPIPAELAHAPFDSDGDATPDTPAELEAQFKKYHPLWASTLRQQLGPGAMILGNALGDVADPSLNGITIEMLRCADNVTACAERFIAQDRASSSAVLPGTSVIWMDSATLSADEQCRVVEEVRQRCPFVQPGTDFYDGSHVVCGGGGRAAAAVAVGMKTLKTDDDDSDDGSFIATTKEVPSTPTVVDKYIFVNASTLALVQKSRLVLNRPQRAPAAAVKPEHEWERWGVYASNMAIQWNATEHRLYYQCDYGMDSKLNWVHDAICLAVSHDHGVTWMKPRLGIATFKGSTDNNILLPVDGNLSTSISLGSVFRNEAPGVSDSERWTMTVQVVNNGVFPSQYPVNKGIGFSAYVMTSAEGDGLHWKFKYPHSWVDASDVQVVTTGWNTELEKYVSFIRFDKPPNDFPSNPSCRDEQAYRSVGMCVSSSLEWLCGPGAQPGANGPAGWPAGMGETTEVFTMTGDGLEPTPQSIDDQVVDIYRSAATKYETGDYLFFAGIYRHFRTSLRSPGCGENNAGHAPNGFANDGVLDVRFLHGGRKIPAKTFEYVDTWDARAPWISLDINRCQIAGDIDTFGGSCDNNNPEELRKTTTGTGTLYMSPGYLLSANGEEIYIFGSAQAFTHGSDAASVTPAGSTQPWGNNTAIVRYILRRDGFTHVQGEYVFNVGYHSLPMVVTQPIRLERNCTRLTLKLNVVTSVVGYVLTELLDPAAIPGPAPPGQPPPWHEALLGFEAATSVSIKGNFISRTVAWGDAPRQRYGFVCGSTTLNGHCNATWEPGSRLSPWEPMTCDFASKSMPNGCAGYSCSAHPGVCNKATGLCEVPSIPDESLCTYRNVTTTASYRDSLHELGGREVQVRLVIPDAKIYSIAFECTRPSKSDDEQQVITVHASPNGPLHSAAGSAAEPASLVSALRLASTATRSGAAAVVQLLPGRYQLDSSISLPSRVALRGQVGAETTLSGGVPITGWVTVPGKPWLFVASLPAKLAGSCVNQLFVAGQRRGAARSATMRFNKTLPTGLHTNPGQLLTHYANISALRVITWQHWTTVIDKVKSIGANDILFSTGAPASYTGDTASGSRFYLENAKEYLASGTGTFFADGDSIWFAPLTSEHASFTSGASEVMAPKPGLIELVSNNNTKDIRLENVVFAHTDVDFVFNTPLLVGGQRVANRADDTLLTQRRSLASSRQSVSGLNNAALHFEFSTNIVLTNVSIEHVGGFGLWFGAGVHNAQFMHGRVSDVGAGAVRIGEASATHIHPDLSARVARNVTISDSVLHDGGNVYKAGCGVLLQAAADSTVTHNEISMFRYTGISAGWDWGYGPTSDGNNTISYNNISTIGMGDLSDLGCVYHLGRDAGTTIHANLCSNVSSFDYGAMGYYLDQASRFVTLTDNVAHDIKCAGFMQNFGINCTFENNVGGFLNENKFTPGSDFSGHTCFPNTGAAVYAAANAPVYKDGQPVSGGEFNFTGNIVHWRQGALLGGGSSLQASPFNNNLYWNPVAGATAVRATGFPCSERPTPPFDPATSHGVLDDGQRLSSPQVLVSESKTAYAAFDNIGRFCVGKGSAPGGIAPPLWCSANLTAAGPVPPQHSFEVSMQGDNNLCAVASPQPGQPARVAWCLGKHEPVGGPHCGAACRYYAKLHDNGTFCMYNQSSKVYNSSTPYSGGVVTWCAAEGVATATEVIAPVAVAAVDGCSLSHWQATGHDLSSRIADPLFVDLEARDFRLRPGSPALAMGMRSLDVSTVGPRRS